MSHAIYTVTLNPALDIHYTLSALHMGVENYASEQRKIAAGKGVNVSRVLKRHGIDAPAYILVGKENSIEYLGLLRQYGVPYQTVTTPGFVRENLSLNCPTAKTETRVCLKSNQPIHPAFASALLQQLTLHAAPGAYVALCGSLPAGVTTEEFVRLCCSLKEQGYALIVDCPSLSLAELKTIDPWLIKPNRKEAMALLRLEESVDGKTLAARLAVLFQQVLLSLGQDGVVYAAGDQLLAKPAIPTDVYTTVGAGDSLVAGFLYGTVTAPGDIEQALDAGLQFAAETCTGMI